MRAVMELRWGEVLAAAPARRPGYVEAAGSVGRRFTRDGEEWVAFTDAGLETLAVYGGPGHSRGCSGCGE
jgi:hypothetical protein